MQKVCSYGQNFKNDVKITEVWEILYIPTESTVSAYYEHAIHLATMNDRKGCSKKCKYVRRKGNYF